MPRDAGTLPGVKDSDLAKVTLGLLNAPDLSANRADRFFGQVLTISEVRAQANWCNETGSKVSVFVQTTYPRDSAKAFTTASPIADLEATKEPIFGRLFMLNGDASQGFWVPLTTEDPGQLLEWLGQQAFKNEPIVLVYRETNVIIERALGTTAEATRRQKLRDKPPAATTEQLLQGLELFHQRELITPVTCPAGVWFKGAASKYYVGQNPEKSIQGQLRTFLNGWFRKTVYAECEDTTRAGRIDVRLLTPSPGGGGLQYWAIVELKITKSFAYSQNSSAKPKSVSLKTNAEAVAEGLRQAHEFGNERNCSPGYLEVYDLRKDKTADVLQHEIVQTQIAKLNPKPVMNIRALYGSASEARKAGVLD